MVNVFLIPDSEKHLESIKNGVSTNLGHSSYKKLEFHKRMIPANVKVTYVSSGKWKIGYAMNR